MKSHSKVSKAFLKSKKKNRSIAINKLSIVDDILFLTDVVTNESVFYESLLVHMNDDLVEYFVALRQVL